MKATDGVNVPLLDLQVQYQEMGPELVDAVRRVLASGQVILGQEVANLESAVAEYCGVPHAVGCSSGTDALLLALQALDIGPGDEVLLPPFTFFATVGAICRVGAKPVFVDIDPQTFNIDPLQVENKVTGRTRAIIPVHLFGQCADMAPLWEIAERHHLHIIEDAAQSFGADYQGKRAGSLGSMGCFSFYPSKILGAFGDAGLVTTNDRDWAAKLACLRGHGMEPRYYHKYIGFNARIDALQAALLNVKLPHVERWITARQAAAARYDWLLEQHLLTRFLDRPIARKDRRHVFNQYVVRVGDGQRDALLRHLKANHIGCDIYYPVPLHLQPCLKHLGHQPGDFPTSETACQTVLALPIYPEITAEQQDKVMQSCAAFLRQPMRKAA